MHTNAPIGEVVISPLNPRPLDVNELGPAEDAAISELAKAIDEQGILQPGVGRRVNGHIELLVGQRRLIAARRLGLEKFPVDVRDLSDIQALTLAMSEQIQRANLPPLDEADAYRKLRAMGLDEVEIAASVGKPPSYVKRRLLLCDLSPKARAALEEDRIGIEHALMLARIPSSKAQEELLSWTLPREGAENDEGASTRELRERIFRDHVLDLNDAPFDPSDPTLVPKAGDCNACPKNTQTQPDLFAGEVSEALALCTDRDCWGGKVNAHLVVLQKRDGRTVLSAAQAAKAFDQFGHVTSSSGYVDLDAKCHAVSPASPAYGKPWKKALGKKGVNADEVVLAKSPTGRVVELIPERTAKAALRKAHPTQAATAPEKAAKKPAPSRSPEVRIDEDVRESLPMAVLAEVLTTLAKSADPNAMETAIRVAAEVAASHCAVPMPEEIQTLLGPGWDTVTERVDKQRPSVALACLLAALMVPVIEDDGIESSRLKALCKMYKVKPKDVEKKLRAKLAGK